MLRILKTQTIGDFTDRLIADQEFAFGLFDDIEMNVFNGIAAGFFFQQIT